MQLDTFLFQQAKPDIEKVIKETPEYKNEIRKDRYLESQLKLYENKFCHSVEYSNEYSRMISLLNFVFKNIPKEKYTPIDPKFRYNKEYEQRNKIGEEKLLAVKNRAHSDFKKCTLLFYYVIIMCVKGYYPNIEKLIKNLIQLYSQFTDHLPAYNYTFTEKDLKKQEEDNASTNTPLKRKTHDSKSDCLEQLYKSVFEKTPNDSLNNHNLIADEALEFYASTQKTVTQFLLKISEENTISRSRVIFENFVIEDIMKKNTYTDTADALYMLQKIYELNLLQKINLAYQQLRKAYLKRKFEIIASHSNNPLGLESVFEDLNDDEVKLLNYLYKIYRKYSDKKTSDHHDITETEEQQQWDILTSGERETLAEYVYNLSNNKTIAKYIRGCHIYTAQDKLFKLCVDIYGDQYYTAFKQAEEIAYICQQVPNWIKKSDKEGQQLYSDLKDSLDKTYAICFQLKKHCYELLEEKAFKKSVRIASKKPHSPKEKEAQTDIETDG